MGDRVEERPRAALERVGLAAVAHQVAGAVPGDVARMRAVLVAQPVEREEVPGQTQRDGQGVVGDNQTQKMPTL